MRQLLSVILLSTLLVCLPLLLWADTVVVVGQPIVVGEDITSNLVGWWKMDEASGNAADSSGNGNTCTIAGNTNYTAESAPINNAINFDGTDDYCSVGDPVSGVLDFGVADFTLAFWTKGTSGLAAGQLLTKGATSLTPAGYSVHLAAGDTIRIRITDGTTAVLATMTGDQMDGTWRHLVIVSDRDVGTLFYKDGVFVNQASLPSNAVNCNATTGLAFGARIATPDLEFTGSLAKVRIYSRALTALQIAALYAIGG